MARSLALYHHDGCGPCWFVRREIDRLGVEVELRDVLGDDRWYRELVAARGRRTVPVLRIEEGGDVRWLPESRDIVRYLRESSGGEDAEAPWWSRFGSRGAEKL